MSALLSLAIDTGAQSPVSSITFTGCGIVRMAIGEPNTVLANCSDGTMLACMYQPAMQLLHLMRRQEHMPLLLQLRDRSPWSYLLIDGYLRCSASGKAEVNGNNTGFDWPAVQGLLLSIQEIGVGVVTLQDTRHLGDTIYGLAKRDRSARRIRPPREALFVTPAEDLLLALPGIGDERCRTLLKYCGGSPAAALDALTDPRQSIPGVGPALQRNAREALGLSDGIRLALLGMTEEEAMFLEPEAQQVTA
jgi:hypothetical protein